MFGPGQNEPLDAAAVRRRFTALAETITRETGTRRTPHAVAEGFLKIAVENMVRGSPSRSSHVCPHGHQPPHLLRPWPLPTAWCSATTAPRATRVSPKSPHPRA
jgi:N-methylhydantoinase A/oxoprolinase/acetone carboxylase beta subunit